MTQSIRNLNLILATSGLSLSVFGLLQALVGHFANRKTRRFFITFFMILSVYVVTILTRELTYDNTSHGWVVLSRVLFFVQGFLASVMTVLVTGLLLGQSGDTHPEKNPVWHVAVILWLIYTGLLIGNLFTGSMYRIDDANNYIRGSYFPLLVTPTVLIMAVNLVTLLMIRKKLSIKQMQALIIYAVAPMTAMIIQAFFFGINLIALSTVISAVIAITYIISDQSEKYATKEAENARLKIDILLAQIQPHFLFNSLTGIKFLIGTDPVKAEEGLTRFIEYLRHNMDSITIDDPIPFEDELTHVRHYLALQKLRFGDDLNAVYDLEYTDFSLPTLTLQPLVENAVNYGVRKKEDGRGTVTVSTRKLPGRVEIRICDDGPGFSEDAVYEDDRSHTGIKNVRERLERVSGGQLRIGSGAGSGTCVTIILPVEDRS